MKITSIKIKNFQCFGPSAVIIDLENLTALVGTNGTGKTAILQALVRLFGSSSERRLRRKDFHLPTGTAESEVENASLSVEVRIEFPEGGDGVAQCFNQMSIEEVGSEPYCRIRLDGEWTRSSAPEGDIEERAYWITTADDDPDDDAKRPIPNADRSLINVHYVPATRDPLKQLRQVSGTILHRLFRAVEWQEHTREAVADACESLRGAINEEIGVQSIQEAISEAWSHLYTLPVHKEVKIQSVSNDFESLLKGIEAVFSSAEEANEAGIESLSDGVKSLFYFTLVKASFAIETAVRTSDETTTGIDIEKLNLPCLTLFAIEEPENHLAPHYLGRIVSLLNEMCESEEAQVVLTSQASGILKRVDPTTVRHVRLLNETQTSVVHAIKLPDEEEEAEAYKFVKEAVRAYPELYFSSLVVFGEGDSEELIIPRIARSSGINLDQAFVSVVPLGGCFVNHFWRLLSDLKIPHITLLDLDRERHNGGWTRVKYVCDQLIAAGKPKAEVLKIDNGVLSDAELKKMPSWPLEKDDLASMKSWCRAFEDFNVFMSGPLDLDLLMYNAYTDEYQATADEGPDVPDEAGKFEKRLRSACVAVLKSENAEAATYSTEQKESFIWYSYLFLGRGKPGTHLRALNKIDDDDLFENAPPVLKRLVNRIGSKLGLNIGAA